MRKSSGRVIVLVEYFFTDARLLAFVIRPDSKQPEIVVVSTDIGRLRAGIRAAATDPGGKWPEQIAAPDVVACVEPLLDYVAPGDVICFVPSEELFYVPMHAIPVDGSPLIGRNPVFYAPSASTLRYCVHRRNTRDRSSRKATVFGNPTYDLKHAITEARQVATLLGTKPLFGVEVSKRQWLEAMTNCDIIHYAGHARFDEGDPLASRLFLSDGHLTARDLFAWTGPSLRLITLSGCETGVNLIHPGDELIGLTRALLHAGASSLLLTLWRVQDQVAPDLMSTFYELWLNGGQRKVDALRNAQLAMLERGQTNPFFWAPYVLVGDWD